MPSDDVALLIMQRRHSFQFEIVNNSLLITENSSYFQHKYKKRKKLYRNTIFFVYFFLELLRRFPIPLHFRELTKERSWVKCFTNTNMSVKGHVQ